MPLAEGNVISKVMLLVCSADLPAKAKVANSVQYNGYHGCNTCTIVGSYVDHNMSWKYDPTAIVRTHDSIILHAKESLVRGKSVSAMCSRIHYWYCSFRHVE